MTRPIRRAVVAGGSGFLGSHLCTALRARGVEVVSLDNHLTSEATNLAHLADDPGLVALQRDVTHPIDLDGPVDLVLHFASPASPVDYARHPIRTLLSGSEGTRHTLELARATGARYVLASTSEVYGDPLVHPQTETYWGNVNPIGPRSVYDEAKRYGEALTVAYREHHGVDAGIVRIFNTYGPRMRPYDGRAVPTFIRQALAGEPLTVTGGGAQTRSVCYVDDLVSGVLAMADSDEPGPINLGNPVELSVLRLAQDVVAATGSASTIVHIDRPVDDPGLRCPDITLARRRLGWTPHVDWPEGLTRTIDWFRTAIDDGAVGRDPAEVPARAGAPGR
ncbi:NAD-dependent epimerase/dehydratase family protein [Mobilicoccus massiliensis]|uniref:NAD-dependent epimerase/dehydratase family protein n=1 Tax=Mobilicoccus massiliensis TaxID=1522310 RepID=UPI00069508AB|nr:NAD-dependent epimerase/dehydratase family protein [Mobilicoccus massiliensis]